MTTSDPAATPLVAAGEADAPPPAEARCPNCGATRLGRFCVDCGQEIRRERLEANPWASHCIDCKRKLEGG